MAKRPKHDRHGTDDVPPTASRYRVAHYGKSRNFAVYETTASGEQALLAVTLYRKGAEAVTARLDEHEQHIAEQNGLITEQNRCITELQSRLAAQSLPPVSPPLPAAASAQAPAWHPPQQLSLLAAEDAAPYPAPRRTPAHAQPRPMSRAPGDSRA